MLQVWAGKHTGGPPTGNFPQTGAQTATFLQQVQKTIELSLSRLWKCRVLLVS